MKLIFCRSCQDVVRLRIDSTRKCDCGQCGGHYTDDKNAEYWGETAVPLGIDNPSLAEASFPYGSRNIDAFVLPANCGTMTKRVGRPAPWTAEQVAALKRFQGDRSVHSFTCECGHIDLVPTEDGWVCPNGCGYTQNWAHSFMLEWEADEEAS